MMKKIILVMIRLLIIVFLIKIFLWIFWIIDINFKKYIIFKIKINIGIINIFFN